MSKMSGVVQELGMKEVNTKFGVKPTFSMKVNSTWVKCGFKSPMCSVGDTVEFEGTAGTYGLEGKEIKVMERGTGGGGAATPTPAASEAAVPVPAGKSYGSSRVFPIPALHGDRSIVRQNALARATDLFIGSAGGKPYTIDESTCNLVILFARKFEAYTAGDLDMAAAVAADDTEV
jgi:hypothetical protein